MPSIRLTGDIAHIMEGTRAQAADLNLTLAEDGFPVAVTIRKGPLEVLTEAESGAIFCGSRAEFFRGLTMLATRFDGKRPRSTCSARCWIAPETPFRRWRPRRPSCAG